MTTKQTPSEAPNAKHKLRLILGGARSGKSRLAEQYAREFQQKYQGDVVYIATAENGDGEMNSRIELHKAQRPEHWQVIEAPTNLTPTIIRTIEKQYSYFQAPLCILVDCLTLWLSNCLCQAFEAQENTGQNSETSSPSLWQKEQAQLLNFLEKFSHQATSEGVAAQNQVAEFQPIEIILVSNEVGHGIVPMGELSREFVDQSGWLHQAIAKHATDVDFVMAGLPLALKSSAKEQA